MFESAGPGALSSRHSYLGTDPCEVYKAYCTLDGPDHLKIIEKELKKYRTKAIDKLPSFFGGAVGYSGYDCVREFDPVFFKTINVDQKDETGVPDSFYMFFKTIVIFDHLVCRIVIVSCVKVSKPADYDEEGDRVSALKDSYNEAVSTIKKIYVALKQSHTTDYPSKSESPSDSAQLINTSKDEFIHHVNSLKHDIESGEIIQGVISRRFCVKTNATPLEVYRKMRTINPSPYMFLLNFGDFQLVGASPELLVRSDGKTVVTCPIAGTAKRGLTDESDNIIQEALLKDTKEVAEHSMLVDLARNDINRVCIPITTNVDSLMRVERFSHVMHIVSEVSGQLRSECSIFDAFRSVFPAGTVSGAPKSRAMHLLYKLETKKRSIYAGSVGYFNFCGGMDNCIVLRAIVFKGSNAICQAGAGIVYDSEPYKEYIETEMKLSSCIKALVLAENDIRAKNADMKDI